ncbi:unnamed protein product [Porites lobata]|uniref:C2H2-type domain-containing protein n=1 Tax=Porites lobata TaxID=104759 RepID=A0ABN8SCJ9_9CNID|nr:unnamed protein product [Porites lobata]
MSIVWLNHDMEPLRASEFVNQLYATESSPPGGSIEQNADLTESSGAESEDAKEEEVSHSGVRIKQEKRPCPIPQCNAEVVRIPRHLVDVHGWTKEHARTALVRFGLRKTYGYSSPSKVPKKKKKPTKENMAEKEDGKRKDYHHYHYCPMDGCTSLVKRMPPHLKKVHKLLPDSTEYKAALSRVRGPVSDSQRRPYHERQRSSGRDKRESPVIYKRIRILDDSESEEKESEHRSIHTRVEEIEHVRVEAIEKIEDETDENGSSFENPQKLADDVITEFEAWLRSADGGQLSGAHNIQITQAQYTLIRDFLLVEISIDNANRAGALANMTVAEYDRMTKESDEFVVLVKNHKTLSTHGSARIVFSAKLKSWMDVFLREVRLKITASNTGPDNCVFITSTGEAMVSSQINKAIKSVWKKAEVEGAPSSTLFRKSAVSSVHSCSESNEARGNLADLMAHNVSTATRFYRLREKSKSSVKASQHLRQVMRGNDESPSISTVDEGGASKCTLSKDQEMVIRDLFEEEIKSKSVTMATVREKIADNMELKDEDPKKILDKVRGTWRYSSSTQSEPVNLPDEQETLEQRVERSLDVQNNPWDIATTTTEASGVRNLFSTSDLDILRAMFKVMITTSIPISRPKVKEILENENGGKGLMQKASLGTIINRVKYERRVFRASKNTQH